MYRIIFLSLFLLCAPMDTAKVTWKPNTDFEIPENFASGHRPCSKQTVRFPPALSTGVLMSGSNSFQGLILPLYGDLVLDDDAELNFGVGNNGESCMKREVDYIQRKEGFSWLQADVWSSDRFTAATPDAVRVPCSDDDVVFPFHSQFSIKLPATVQEVHSITIKNNLVDPSTFKESIEAWEEPTQTFVLNDELESGLEAGEACVARAGCACQRNVSRVDCARKRCRAAPCAAPITPTGNCCPICGGMLEFDINRNTFDMASFKKRVEDVVNAYGGPNQIASHVGLLWDDRAQVVLVDRGSQHGNSKVAAAALARGFGSFAAGYKMSAVSGPSASSVSSGLLVVVALVVALALFPLLYVWSEHPFLARLCLPRFNLPNVNAFSRFNNRENSITSFLSSRGFVPSRASFRNPLFQKEESVSREESKETGADPEDAHSVSLSTEVHGVHASTISLIHDIE